ncbi:hypothetical protein ACRRTK_000635 [Alexandromys fortis]
MRTVSWAVVTHTFNPSIWEAEAGGSQSEQVPGPPGSAFRKQRAEAGGSQSWRPVNYRVSSRTARATQRNPASKNNKTNQTNKQKKYVDSHERGKVRFLWCWEPGLETYFSILGKGSTTEPHPSPSLEDSRQGLHH